MKSENDYDPYANLIFLEDLCKRGYLIYSEEITDFGNSIKKDDMYILSIKGLRIARVFLPFQKLYIHKSDRMKMYS